MFSFDKRIEQIYCIFLSQFAPWIFSTPPVTVGGDMRCQKAKEKCFRAEFRSMSQENKNSKIVNIKNNNFENCYMEILFKKNFISIPEGHIGFYEIRHNSETGKFEARVPIDRNTEYFVPEDFYEERNPSVKIVD